jgi:hypothetical protein
MTYMVPKNVAKTHWPPMTANLNMVPGWYILMNANKCIFSFSASSSSKLVQPPSRSIVRNALKWRNMAPTKPGTAAIVSRKIALNIIFFCVSSPMFHNVAASKPLRSNLCGEINQ